MKSPRAETRPRDTGFKDSLIHTPRPGRIRAMGKCMQRRGGGNSKGRGYKQQAAAKKGVVQKKPAAPKWASSVPYNPPGSQKVDFVRLRDLSDITFPEIVRMTENQASKKLNELGFKPPLVQRTCWRCSKKLKKTLENGKVTFRCNGYKCPTKLQAEAYTPLHNRGGGAFELTNHKYLMLAWAFGHRVPPDLAVPLTGCSWRVQHRVYDYFRNACAVKVEDDGRMAYFNDGE